MSDRRARIRSSVRKVTKRAVKARPTTYWVLLTLECGHTKRISAGSNPSRYGNQLTAQCSTCYFEGETRAFQESQS